MIVLDTDHINVLQNSSSPGASALLSRLAAAADKDVVVTVITLEEQLRGWLGLINRKSDVQHQVDAYRRLTGVVRFFNRWLVIPFDDGAASRFTELRRQRIRIGTMDLKIASIALEQGALVLSANLRDFRQVPSLRVEDWIH